MLKVNYQYEYTKVRNKVILNASKMIRNCEITCATFNHQVKALNLVKRRCSLPDARRSRHAEQYLVNRARQRSDTHSFISLALLSPSYSLTWM